MDVLVTGADQRQGLAVIRALGTKGLKVFAAGLEPNSLGFSSRYTNGFCKYPSPVSDKKGFVSVVLQIVKEYRIPVVFPAVESTVIALDEFRDEFHGITRLALPSRKSLSKALDKRETLALAKELNIPIPESCVVDSISEALSFAEKVGYPIVMKPRSLGSYGNVPGHFNFKVTYVKNQKDLENHLRRFDSEGAFPLFQEYCPGIKINQGLLYADGELLGLYQYKGIREYPLTGGVTSLHLSIPVDDELKEWTMRLLQAMKWDGVAMVEYKVNESTGKKVLMEVNGRFWAPQSGANKLGLNFPYSLYRYVLKGVKEKLTSEYPLGKKNRYLRGDLVGLINHWQGHSANYLTPLPSKGRALWNVIRDFRPGVQYDVLDWRDPYPGIKEILSLVKQYGNQVPVSIFRKMIKTIGL